MMARAAEIVAETGGFPTDQFNNRDALDGYREIGEEIVEQLGDGSVDAFCAYVGVGGCFLGATTALRQRWPEMLRVTVEPEESAVMSGARRYAPHRGRWRRVHPALLEDGGWDEVIAVSTADAGDMARKAARREGIWTGRSGGANLTAALRLAHRLGGGHRVVTVQPDSGLKYLNGDMYR